MQENLDVRMNNYLTILGNPSLSRNFDPNVLRTMEQAVAIYVSKTSKEYVAAYENKEKETLRGNVLELDGLLDDESLNRRR